VVLAGVSEAVVAHRLGADPKAAAALECTPLLFAHPTPDTGILPGLEGPLEALVSDRTAPAHRFGLLYLKYRGARRPDREEQLRVFISADSTVTPVHGGNTPLS
jgi:hypothetical protein